VKPLLPVALLSLLLFLLMAGTLFVAPTSANFFPEQIPSGHQHEPVIKQQRYF
jgi:hypothetical protein